MSIAKSASISVRAGRSSARSAASGGRSTAFEKGVFTNNVAIRVSKITDGTSKVFLLGETRYAVQWIWSDPTWSSGRATGWDSGIIRLQNAGSYFWANMGATYNGINYSSVDPQNYNVGTFDSMRQQSFGSRHGGGGFLATADGAVRFVMDFDVPAKKPARQPAGRR